MMFPNKKYGFVNNNSTIGLPQFWKKDVVATPVQQYSSPIGPNTQNAINTMSGGFGAGSLLSGAAALGSMIYSIYNTEMNRKQERRAYEESKAFAREQYEYQKKLNQLLMNREDNAVWRRMQDLKKSGLNPLLALGDSASASSGSAGNYSFQNPNQISGSDVTSAMAGISNTVNQLSTADLQYRLGMHKINMDVQNFSLQRIKTLDDLISNAKTRDEKDELIKLRKKELEIYNHNLKIARQYGEPVGISPDPASASGVIKLLAAGDDAPKTTAGNGTEVPNHVKKTVDKNKSKTDKGEKIWKSISGYGPPTGELKLYQFYTDINTGLKYRFGERFYD